MRGVKRSKGWLIVGLCILTALLASVPAKTGARAQSIAPRGVMVSFLPLLDSAQRIAGGRLEVSTLLPVGASPHAFDPTPRDLVTVRGMGLLILSGYGIDAWLERVWRAGGSRAKLVKLAERAAFPRIGTPPLVDGHVWLDVSIMATMALEIGEAYAALDSQNAAAYRRAAAVERTRLLALHSELRRTLEPVRGRGLVVFHNAWNYFVRAYGLRVLATVRVEADREPNARDLAVLIALMRREAVRAIFIEPQLPDRTVRTLAVDVGARVYTLDPEGSSLAPDYTAMMRYNAATILEALR